MNKFEEITFSKGCDEWLLYKQNTVKESSYLNYKFKINKYLIPDLGNKTLTELVKYDMNEYIIKKKNQKGMTENILKDCVMFLNYNPISKGTSSVPSPPIILTEGDRMKIGRRPYSGALSISLPSTIKAHK